MALEIPTPNRLHRSELEEAIKSALWVGDHGSIVALVRHILALEDSEPVQILDPLEDSKR